MNITLSIRTLIAKISPAMVLLLLNSFFSSAQVTYIATTTDLVVSGTSTLHNWDMKSAKANCTATFSFNNTGQIAELTTLSFSTPVNSLKSNHSGMDNNAYKALKSDKNSLITYTLTSVTVTPAAAGASTVKCTGKLTIAGTSRTEDIVAICKPNTDNTITVSGSRSISMKDFSMEPPTFMMGTIKTGNDIVLTFNMVLKKP